MQETNSRFQVNIIVMSISRFKDNFTFRLRGQVDIPFSFANAPPLLQRMNDCSNDLDDHEGYVEGCYCYEH